MVFRNHSVFVPVPPDLYSTQEGPLLVPLHSQCLGDMDFTPWRLSRTPVQGGYPQYHSILFPPRVQGVSPGPLTPRFKCLPATNILPITFFWVFHWVYNTELQCKTIHQLKEFIKKYSILVIKKSGNTSPSRVFWPFLWIFNCSWELDQRAYHSCPTVFK